MIGRSTFDSFRHVSEMMQQAAAELQQAQIDAATLDRLRNPSDHPLDVAESMKLEMELDAHDALTERMLGVTNELLTVDGVLAEVSNLLVRAQEIAIAMESGTVNAEERATAAVEVDSLFDSLISAANTHYNNVYVFGGTAVDTIPFLSSGTYQGAGQGRSVPLLGSDTLTVSYPGDEVFRGAGGDVFQAVEDLAAALRNNDIDAIETAGVDVGSAHSHINSMRGSYGAAQSRTMELTEASEEAALSLHGFIGSLTELDMLEAFSNLAQAQTSYEAAASTLSTALNTSIFKYL